MIEIKSAINEIKETVKNSTNKYVVPVWCEIVADLETPVSAYHKVCQGKEYSFLLESVEKGENVGRFSFIGADPLYILKSDHKESIIFGASDNEVISSNNNPYDLLEKLLQSYSPLDLDLPYTPGAVGYFGYDSVRHIETGLNKIFENIEGCESFPEAYFMIAGTVLAFDHVNHKIYIINNVLVDNNSDINRIRSEAEEKIRSILDKLSLTHNLLPLNLYPDQIDGSIESNISKKEWIEAVITAKEHIKAGDIFQVVLSQRFCIEKGKTDTFDIYRALRIINPSPYLFYLDFKDFQIIGSSPEVMVKCSGEKTAHIRPIAGTRPRGATLEEDNALSEELLNDPKEVAEHIMLVDLGRNDLGRVCEYGSVKVKEIMKIEKYSHVQHIVSDVTGKLRNNLNSIDLVKACFPAGTLSGAPKVRAMEIIYNLEKAARGPYGGCIGHFGFNNEVNTAITIRTMLVRDNKIFIQAGAGIVADSDPEKEYQETKNKAAALIQTVKRLQKNA